jgi:hypothetical protein
MQLIVAYTTKAHILKIATKSRGVKDHSFRYDKRIEFFKCSLNFDKVKFLTSSSIEFHTFAPTNLILNFP